MRVVKFLLALSLCGCASNAPLPGPTGLPGFDGFPTNFADGDLLATAHFKINHASNSECRIDLISERQVLPIWVSAGIKKTAERSDTTLITREHMDMRLYLPDGTALMPISNLEAMVDSLDEKPRKNVSGRLFQSDVLEALNNTRRGGPNNGYVFFEMPHDGSLSISGSTVQHRVGDAIRSFDLDEALISFNITVAGTPRPVMVGVQ